jgi:hypothetical protein
MQVLGAADVLDVWELGRGQSAAERALTLLERVCPERDREALLRLPLGDRDRLLLEARAAVLGPTLEATAACPACGEQVEFQLAVATLLADIPAVAAGAPAGRTRQTPQADPSRSTLRPAGAPAATGEGEEVTLGDYALRVRPPDSADLLAAASCVDAQTARELLVERCVVAAHRDGAAVEPSDLPPHTVAALAEHLAAADAHLETLLDLTCPACAATWRAELDAAAFVWEEIRARALVLLDDVDVLARAYGWTEAEILTLGAERRRLYVERALA